MKGYSLQKKCWLKIVCLEMNQVLLIFKHYLKNGQEHPS